MVALAICAFISYAAVSLLNRSRVAAAPHVHGRVIRDASNVISGQINPAAIPDDPAFSVLLILLSRQDSGQDVARARAYIQYLIGLDHGECLDPATEPQLPAELLDARARVKASCPPDTRWVTDSARLLSVARDFGEANSRFVEERRSAAQGGRVPADVLVGIQQRQRALLRATLASFDARLGARAAARVRDYVRYEMKKRMKLIH
jgi:hypothetical protein